MKKIIVVFSVYLALASSAQVVCHDNLDGTWTCGGSSNPGDPGGGGGGSPGPGVITNYVGICTNCINTTPAQCEEFVLKCFDNVDQCSSYLDQSKTKLDALRQDIEVLQTEGDQFVSFPSVNDYRTYPVVQENYFRISSGQPSTLFAAGESIYRYYNQSVKPVLGSALSQISDTSHDIDIARSNLAGIYDLVGSLDCSSCSSGGNIPSSPGSSSSGQCPCKEQMEALVDLLKDDFLPKAKTIASNSSTLTNIITIVNEGYETISQGFQDVTNLFTRLDDYVLDDFSQRVYKINVDVSYIASNLQSKLGLTIDQSYSNAQFYLSQDGQSPTEMKNLHDTLFPPNNPNVTFDFAEFEKLPWFTRVEFLLLNLSGAYASTSTVAKVGTEDAEQMEDDINDAYSDYQAVVEGDLKTGFSGVASSVTSFFSSFNSAVGSSSDQVRELQLMSNFLGDEPLVLKIDPDVQDAARTITSLLWSLLFGFLLYRILLAGWLYFVSVVQWWVNQTQGFMK